VLTAYLALEGLSGGWSVGVGRTAEREFFLTSKSDLSKSLAIRHPSATGIGRTL